jgi:hypothetical protein
MPRSLWGYSLIYYIIYWYDIIYARDKEKEKEEDYTSIWMHRCNKGYYKYNIKPFALPTTTYLHPMVHQTLVITPGKCVFNDGGHLNDIQLFIVFHCKTANIGRSNQEPIVWESSPIAMRVSCPDPWC